MTKSDSKSVATGRGKSASATAKGKAKSKSAKSGSKIKVEGSREKSPRKSGQKAKVENKPIIVKHEPIIPEGLPKKYFLKSTFNTQDIMHAPVEKTLKMLDKILTGERLFTM